MTPRNEIRQIWFLRLLITTICLGVYSAKGYQLLAERYAENAIELLSNTDQKVQQ